jgi:hypothetical protein
MNIVIVVLWYEIQKNVLIDVRVRVVSRSLLSNLLEATLQTNIMLLFCIQYLSN